MKETWGGTASYEHWEALLGAVRSEQKRKKGRVAS